MRGFDVSPDDEARCDAWAANGEGLRAAVAWRVFQGKGDVLSAMTGVHIDVLGRFVDTGEIGERDRMILEMTKG